MSIMVRSKKRVVCPVCQFRGVGDWMGDVYYLDGSPEQWQWFATPKTNVFGNGPAPTDDPSNPTGDVFKSGFYQRGRPSLIASSDGGEYKPRCPRGHMLRILKPATMTDLIRRADDKVERAWIAIPE